MNNSDLRELCRPLVGTAFLSNPYPAYQALRKDSPVYWSTEFCGGGWLLTRYDDVALALQDARFSVQRAGGWVNSSGPEALGELLEFKRIFSRAMLFLNAPRHTRLRQVMNAGFKPAAITALAPAIEAIADSLIDAVEGRLRIASLTPTPTPLPPGEGLDHDGAPCFDFMADFARPLPSRVIAHMLGVDAKDCAKFGAWADDIAAFIGSPTPTMELARPAQASLIALTQHFCDLLPERRKNPGGDLVSLLVRAESEGKIKTTKELLAQCSMLLFAGQETTRNLLGNGMLALLQHPAQWRELKREPALLPNALRELLRYESPVQYTGRRLVSDVTLRGQTMKKGDLVIAMIGAANRDPERFTGADTLDILRKDGGNLAFGFGPHGCIGAALTMLEAQIAFRRLMLRLPNVRIADAEARWGSNSVYRGLAGLDIEVVGSGSESRPHLGSEPEAALCPV